MIFGPLGIGWVHRAQISNETCNYVRIINLAMRADHSRFNEAQQFTLV